jgi:hypothetical protein
LPAKNRKLEDLIFIYLKNRVAMKSYTFSLLPTILSLFFLFAQQQSTSDQNQPEQSTTAITPSAEEAETQTFELFKLSTDYAAKSGVVTKGTYLDLDKAALQDLYNARPQHLQLTIPGDEAPILLDMHRNEIFTEDVVFRGQTKDGLINLDVTKGAYYSGHLKGDESSVVTISVFENWMMGILTFDGENYNLGPMDDDAKGTDKGYILFKEMDHLSPPNHECHTEDAPIDYDYEFLPEDETANRVTKVVKVYLECDYRMYTDRNNNEQEVINYITGLFNEMATLYANEQVLTRISEIKVWMTSDPYPSSSSSAALDAFTNGVGPGFNGNLAHLVSTIPAGNGGIAWLGVLCSPTRSHAYSNIGNSYQPVPTYSWSVEVMTHEMGHNLGSRHTHACAWGPNGNQALDNCRATEGSCPPGPAPVNGGTIMSYCHLTSNGINFENGFGTEPGNLIRARVAQAACLEDVFDCFSKIPLEAGITFAGNTANGGARNFENYVCNGTSYRGNEIAHSFTAQVPGWAYINFAEHVPEQLDLFLLSTCNPDSCIDSWSGPIVQDSFMVDFGVEYVFIVDTKEDAPGGAYDLTISFPGSGCATTVSLTDGVLYTGNTSDGATNFINYPCAGMQHPGKETGHFFISPSGGDAKVIFNDLSGSDINLFMASACSQDSCLMFWEGPNVNETVTLEAGVPYYFITDVEQQGGGGDYELSVTLPNPNTCICTDQFADEICENFESFDIGAISPQGQCWTQDVLNPDTDGQIDDAKAASGTNSLFINGENDDVVLRLGNRSFGKYLMRFKVNIDVGKEAFFRAYHTYEPGNPNNEIAFDVRMELTNNQPFAKLYAGDLGSSATFPYVNNGVSWTEFFLELDFDNDEASLFYIGGLLHTWPISNTRNGTGGINSLAALNFYSDSPDGEFYVDDFRLYSNEGFFCDESGALVCDDFDRYTVGAVAQQSNLWTAMNGAGGANDASVINQNSVSGIFGMQILSGVPGFDWDNIVADFGTINQGRYKFSYQMFVPLAKAALVRGLHVFMPDDTTTNEEFNFLLDFGVQNNGVLTTGGQVYTFNYPQNQWIEVIQLMDLDNDQSTIFVDGVPVATFPFSNTISGTGGTLQWQGMNFYAKDNDDPDPNNDVDYFIDNVELFNLDLFMTVDPLLISVPSTSGSVSVDVESNTPLWGPTEDENWLSATPPTGANNGTITIDYEENLNIQSRNGQVKVVGLGVAPKYVDIVQAGADPYMIVDPDTDQTVPAIGGTLDFSVSSNVFWGVRSSDTSWLKPIDPAGGSFDGAFSVDYTTNLGGARQDTIFIEGPPAAEVIIVVTQDASGPSLEVDRDTIFLPFNAGSEVFGVISNVNWNITSSEPWLSVNPDSGSDIETITVDFTDNQTVDPRQAIITVAGDQGTGNREIVAIQEAGDPFMDVSTLEINLPNTPGGTTTFEIDANVSWDLVENASWFDLDATTGSGDGIITLTYDENLTINTRSEVIDITGSNGVSALQIVVNQESSDRILEADPTTFDVGPAAGSVVVNITANIEWFVSTNSLWFNIDPAMGGTGNGTLTINYDENNTLDPRTETIRLYGVGVPDIIITVNQDANAAFLSVDPEEITVSSDMGSVDFNISSNVDFSISDDVSWLTTNRFSGSGNVTVTANYNMNPNPSPRTATVTISEVGGPLVATVTIIQGGQGAVLEASVDTIRVPYTLGQANFDVSSNVFWTLSDDATWLTSNPTTGFGNANVRLNYFENPSAIPRVAIVTVTATGLPDAVVVVIQDGAPTDLSVNPTSLTVPAQAGSAGIDVLGNVAWTATADVPWISLTPDSGTGATSIAVNYDENTATDQRTGTITISGTGGLEVTVEVTQEGAQPFVDADPVTINVGPAAGMVDIDVFANVDWEVQTFDPWVSVTPVTGFGDQVVNISYDENTSADSRQTTISIEAVGSAVGRTVTLIQGGAGAILTVNPSNINVPSPAGNSSFDITSNVNWDITVDVPWITITSSTSGADDATINFDYDENLDPGLRTGTITISGSGASDQEIIVTQDGAGAVLLSSTTEIMVGAPMGSTTFDITSNVNWTLDETASWFSLNQTMGNGSTTITLDFDENMSQTPRSESITLSGDGGVTDITITVTQAGAGAILTVNPLNINVPSPAGNSSFDITANVNWDITVDVPWITITSNTSGSNNAMVNFDYDENLDPGPRTGTITISGTGTVDQEIIVTQDGAGAILLSSTTDIMVGAPMGSTNFDITANVNWTLTETATWFTLSQTMGNGSTTITLNYDENMSQTPRNETITLSGDGGVADITITVTQVGAAAILTVNPSNINVPSPAGNSNFDITANVSWDITVDVPWITITSSTSGSNNASINFDYDENLDPAARTGTITITGAGVPVQEIIVNQDGAGAVLLSSTTNVMVGAPMGSTTFDITSNVNWTLAETATWFSLNQTIGNGSTTITLDYDENMSPTSRSETITLSGDGGVANITITVTQAGAGAILTASTTSLMVTSPAGSTSFDVSSNVNWTITESDSWFTATPDNGNGNLNITVNYTENMNTTTRLGSLTLSGDNGVPDIVISITQAGAAAFLTVGTTDVSVSPSAGNTNVMVNSNVNWTAVSSDSWLRVNPGSGTGTVSLDLDYDANPDPTPRTATITVSASGLPDQEILVTQEGLVAILTVNPGAINVSAPSGSTDFDISSNTTWTISGGAGWFTVNQINGNGNATISINYDENFATSSRSATLTISGNGAGDQEVVITQEAAAAFLGVSTNVINLTAPAGSTDFDVNANVTWTVISVAPWLSIDQTTGSGNTTINIDYTENTGTTLRTATILVTANGLADQIITINQEGTIAAFLNVTPPGNQNVNNVAGNQVFNVNANVPWSVTSDAPWLSVNPASGNGVGLFVASWSANPDQSQRAGTIVVTGNGVPIVTITITQNSFAPSINADPTTFNVGPDAGTVTTDLTSNVTWSVNASENWVTASPNFGSGNSSIDINYDANPNATVRSATLTISGGGAPDITVVLNQSESTSTKELELYYGLNVYPNPVSDQMYINFNLPESENLDMQIVSVTGRILRDVTNDVFKAGNYNLRFPIGSLANGMYFLRFKTDQGVITKRFMVSK